MSESNSSHDQGYEQDSDSNIELNVPRRSHKSGRHVREEPTSLGQLQACPLAMTCFQQLSRFQYCQMISQIQHHWELVHLFVLHLHDGSVKLAGVNFTLTPKTISEATGMPNIGGEWNKRQKLDRSYYEPYIRPSYLR